MTETNCVISCIIFSLWKFSASFYFYFFLFAGKLIEVKCFNLLLNLFSRYTIDKILGMLQRCLLSSHQIMFLQNKNKLMFLQNKFCTYSLWNRVMRRYSAIIMRSKGATLVPLPFGTLFSFLSQGICRSHIGQNILLIFLFLSLYWILK